MRATVLRFASVLALAAAVGCSNSVSQPIPLHLAGVYTLAAEVPRGGPVSGSLTLLRDGTAIRSVAYASPAMQVSETGTYRPIGDDQIELRLNEVSGSSTFVWTVRATVLPDGLLLTYPHPADGTVEELYRRSVLRQSLP